MKGKFVLTVFATEMQASYNINKYSSYILCLFMQ